MSQKILPKKPKVRANVVGSAKVPRQRQRKPAKRGRKRKSVALEAEAPEPIAKVARTSKAPARASVVQMSETLVAEDEIVPGPWRALVARVY